MSGTNTDVPSIRTFELPRPVPLAEFERCPVAGVFARIGDRWSMLVVIILGARPHRYNELHRSIEGISQRMLTRTLRLLESDGLVSRTVLPTVPPSVEYDLTPLGGSLLDALTPLADWAVRNAPRTSAPNPAPSTRSAPRSPAAHS